MSAPRVNLGTANKRRCEGCLCCRCFRRSGCMAGTLQGFRADEDRYLEQVEQRLKKSDALLQEAKAAQAMTANAETKNRYLEQVEQRLLPRCFYRLTCARNPPRAGLPQSSAASHHKTKRKG